MELKDKLISFRNEINNGINDITAKYFYMDSKLEKKEYAFLYWILMNVYNVDDELIQDHITEYNDKAIDCFVHFEENKELYIIQCKYYDINGVIDRKDVTDFLQTPYNALMSGNYKRSKTLQKIFSNAINDPEYKIFFHFYSASNYFSEDIATAFKAFNSNTKSCSAYLHSEFFDLKGIYNLYYGKSFHERKSLTFELGTVNRGTFASLREEYHIPLRCEAYYIITPVYEIYRLLNASKTSGYQLFEENIREFLGEKNPSSVNKGIMDTLRSDSDRQNFLFYNNGITMICKSVGREIQKNGMRYMNIENPQIVNGCQTVNSIYYVLDDLSSMEIENKFKNVFVLVKVLAIDNNSEEDKKFYQDVVKYTNRQNAVPDKVFSANGQPIFNRLQNEFMKHGFFLRVKQSDKNKFDTEFSEKQKADMMVTAKTFIKKIGYEIKNPKDICIDLEKLLQVLVAYIKDGYFAYKQKSSLLKQSSDVFKTISINIQDYLSIENMIRIYYLYMRAEIDKKQINDNRATIPYYILGFISYHIQGEHTSEAMNSQLDLLFNLPEEKFNMIYAYLKKLVEQYKYISQKNNIEYNVMIKQKINNVYVNDAITTYKTLVSDEAYNILSIQ